MGRSKSETKKRGTFRYSQRGRRGGRFIYSEQRGGMESDQNWEHAPEGEGDARGAKHARIGQMPPPGLGNARGSRENAPVAPVTFEVLLPETQKGQKDSET